MTLDILKADMAAALKNGQTLMRSVLSDAVAAVQKAAIDRKQKDNITEELVNEVLLKEIKTICEMIDTCPAERQDLLEEYNSRYDILYVYAPKIISDKGEIMCMIDTLISEQGLDTSNKGKLMKELMPQLKGKVDLKVANQVIAQLFS